MRTIETTIYKFDELSEDAKQKAIESLSDINTDHGWWESVYEDAKSVGLDITGFDLDNSVGGRFEDSGEVTAKKIMSLHGESCETFKTAKNWLESYLPQKEKFEKENPGFYFRYEDESSDLEAEFLQSICEDYRIMLRNEYEHLSSKASIIETIKLNDYEFYEDGKLV